MKNKIIYVIMKDDYSGSKLIGVFSNIFEACKIAYENNEKFNHDPDRGILLGVYATKINELFDILKINHKYVYNASKKNFQMKSKLINNLTNHLAKKLNSLEFNKDECHQIEICVFCNTPVNYESFRDNLSRKEYEISNLCQKCQDEVFGE